MRQYACHIGIRIQLSVNFVDQRKLSLGQMIVMSKQVAVGMSPTCVWRVMPGCALRGSRQRDSWWGDRWATAPLHPGSRWNSPPPPTGIVTNSPQDQPVRKNTHLHIFIYIQYYSFITVYYNQYNRKDSITSRLKTTEIGLINYFLLKKMQFICLSPFILNRRPLIMTNFLY